MRTSKSVGTVEAEPLLTGEVDCRPGVVRIALAGDLDMLTAPIVRERLSSVEGDGVTEIVLDLRHLAFIDATGMLALLDARADAEANGHRLILDGVTDRARRLFVLTGTEFLLDEREAICVLDV